jgi:basic membrane protein A and related proteins
MAVFAAAVTGSDSQAAATKKAQGALKIAIVTDIGGLNDRGFNALSNAGLNRAKSQLGIDASSRAFVTNSASDRVPNLLAAARQGYGLVIAVGFLMFDPLNTVAPAVPDTKFAGVDVPYALLDKKPPNVRGIQFKEQEAGYLAGYIAGLVLKQQGGRQVVSSIGANKVPAIVKFLAGYRGGVKRANPGATVLSGYANDPTFADQAKCKELALNQIARGSKIIFHAAGGCGLGAMSAAKEKKVWGIGVDSDQSFLGPHMLTSATKKVDVAVYQMIRAYKANPEGFKGGFDTVFNVKNNGVGYGKIATNVKNRAQIIVKVEAIKKLIASGKIVPPAE